MRFWHRGKHPRYCQGLEARVESDAGDYSFGFSTRIFPAAISSRATVTGLLLATSTIGNCPSLRTRARFDTATTSTYLFSIFSSSDSREGRIIMVRFHPLGIICADAR